MPSSFSGLLLFVMAFTPGFVFLLRSDSRNPSPTRSSIRETGVIVTASAVFLVFGLALTSALHLVTSLLLDSLQVNFRQLTIAPSRAYAKDPGRVITWAATWLAVACGMAAMAAVPPLWLQKSVRWVNSQPLVPFDKLEDYFDRRSRPVVSVESGWVSAFQAHQDSRPHVGVELASGGYLQGELQSYTAQVKENGERSIRLLDATYWPPGLTEGDLLENQSVIVGADQIRLLTVEYFPVSSAEGQNGPQGGSQSAG